ncbi:MAG: hypothetical protein V3R85_00205 [Alphaproteobacteria bacterium]
MRRMLHSRVWAFAVLALLTASCVGAESEPASDRPPSSTTASDKPGSDRPAPDRPAPTAALPPVEIPAPPSLPPEKLIGLDHVAIKELLGQPRFRRADAPAELWRYRAGRCILDLFLYPPKDTPGGALAVTHIEARLRNGTPTPTPRCLNAVLKARAAAGTT